MSEQILTKDEINHQIWKEKIISALGDEVKVLYGIIPELKIILGEKDELVELNPNDGKIRFDNYLFKYLQLFATKEEPLFIFLDDMQWSDNITLNWLEKAIYRLSNVFIIISYRDNEVKDDSSLSLLIKELEKNEIKTFVYNLKPLKILDIKNLIDNNINIRNSEDIAKIVFNKTSGNAFFVKQFLKQLLSNNVLYFDYEKIYLDM